MTRNCIKKVKKLEGEIDDFGDLIHEQLLYAAIDDGGLSDIINNIQHSADRLVSLVWREGFKGKISGTKIQKITVVYDSGVEREIDFQQIPYAQRVKKTLQYL